MDGPSGPGDGTVLLRRWQQGDEDAFREASEVVYPELRRIAQAYLGRERSGHTLQPTALIHEAYLRFGAPGRLQIGCRKQFYALAAHLMRRVLVDHARSFRAAKRGGGGAKLPVEGLSGGTVQSAEDLILIHTALDELAALNPRKARLIELRYFGGLTLAEASDILDLPVASAHREQRLAEAWLAQRLGG